MTEHKLVNDTLTREKDGIAARCVCGWASLAHFTSLAASVAFQDHQKATVKAQIINPSTCPNSIFLPAHFRGPDETCNCYVPQSKQMKNWGYKWDRVKRHFAAATVALALVLSTTACEPGRPIVWEGGPNPAGDLSHCNYEAVRAVPSSTSTGRGMLGDVLEIVEAREEIKNACMADHGYYQTQR
jgi:hypothetical protein